MEDLIAFAIQVGTLLPFVLLSALCTRTLRLGWLLAALGLLFADFCVTCYAGELPWLDFPQLSWNWVGKGASVLLSLAVLWLAPGLRQPSGATLVQRRHSLVPNLVLLGLLAAAAVYFGRQSGPQPFRLETLLFQSSMPSLSEELIFRGLALHLLNAALGHGENPTLRRMGFGVPVVAIWFGLGHSIYWAEGALQVSWFSLWFTGGIGIVLMVMRLWSGSLLLPMLGHSVFNVLITLMPMLREN